MQEQIFVRIVGVILLNLPLPISMLPAIADKK
jgi:hypothetical protein